jgi:RES domain-containing protein
LWRISNHSDLVGIGGEMTSGRWHTAARGKRIVYLSEHPALALIEVLVNLKGNPLLFPDRYQLLKVTVQDYVSVAGVSQDILPGNWRDDADATRVIGDDWLTGGHPALLTVPSVPCPEATNYLFNPLHADAHGVTVEWVRWVEYDRRLFTSRLDFPRSPK